MRAYRAALVLATALLCRLARADSETATISIAVDQPGAVISPNLYGQFAEHLGHGIYGGIWVGEDSSIPNIRGMRKDVIEALKELKVPVIRWPGGCFADTYHWKDGIGPRDKRPKFVNISWGGVTEDNAFGTHEFMDFCSLVGAKPYIAGNLGSGTTQEMHDWVEYMTSSADSPMANLRRANGRQDPWEVPFFGVGNESWGCGGSMTPEYYANLFRQYNTFVKSYSGSKIYRVACGPGDDDYNWTEQVMKGAAKQMNGISLHHYSLPTGDWKHKGSATEFGEEQYYSTLRRAMDMETLVTKNIAIMDKYDPKKRVGLLVDEWGVWTDVEPGTNSSFLYQQNSLRDAITAAVQLHIFQEHADRVVMANIAQMINVLQAMILTDGPHIVLTPTYQVFKLLIPHQGATSLPATVSGPQYTLAGTSVAALSASASKDAQGRIHISIANVDPNHPISVSFALAGMTVASASGQVVTAPSVTSHNTTSAPDTVRIAELMGVALTEGHVSVTLPAASVSMLELTPGA